MDNTALKSFPITISLSLTLLFSTLLHPCLSELCNPNDKRALLRIKQAFNHPPLLASWDPHTDCCLRWDSVTCHPETRRVASLSVSSSLGVGLSGRIPLELADLTHLEFLRLDGHRGLAGPVTPALARLRGLTHLLITRTSVSGPVPAFLAELESLELVDLSSNRLSGPIPSSLSKLPNLYSLDLRNNSLTGPIPSSFGELRGHEFSLHLSRNELSGEIPASLGKKKDFGFIDLSRNKLEGDASTIFGPDKAVLMTVDLSRNLLEFDLSEVEFPKMLMSLDISHNKICGALPVGMAALDHLRDMNVSHNRLCGKIPIGGFLQSLDASAYLYNNCLCGSPLSQSCQAKLAGV